MTEPQTPTYNTILVNRDAPIATVTLNRPQALNALNRELMRELVAALLELDGAEEIRCIVITGSERAFAAGADIKDMVEATPVDMLRANWIAYWEEIRKVRKPLVAAVSGYALGGGCELAMSCDMIVASETARFGQPEINIGIIPGAGGTQRLTLAVGKARAMEMVLTGRQMTAREAEAAGLVNRVSPPESYLEDAKTLAREVAARPPIAVQFAKQAVNRAFEGSLQEGLAFERHLLYLLFATADQKEGMRAFIAKRKPEWKGE